MRILPAVSGGRVPEVSDLDLGAGATRANAAIGETGQDGRVQLLDENGELHLVADLAGVFVPVP